MLSSAVSVCLLSSAVRCCQYCHNMVLWPQLPATGSIVRQPVGYLQQYTAYHCAAICTTFSYLDAFSKTVASYLDIAFGTLRGRSLPSTTAAQTGFSKPLSVPCKPLLMPCHATGCHCRMVASDAETCITVAPAWLGSRSDQSRRFSLLTPWQLRCIGGTYHGERPLQQGAACCACLVFFDSGRVHQMIQ